MDGLHKTKDDVVERVIAQVLKAETFGDVYELTSTAHTQLKNLGCFSVVNAIIDTSKGNDSTDLEVTFSVEEQAFLHIHATTETGDNEALGVVRSSLPNLTGRGDAIDHLIKIGSGGTQHFSLNFSLPFRSDLLWKLNSGLCDSSLIACLYRNCHKLPSSKLQGTFQGLSLSAKLSPKPWLTQSVTWDCAWRYLTPLQYPGFTARSMSGHSLKSSLINAFVVNTLDDHPLPSEGVNLSFTQELAGLGIGNVAFFKTVANGGCFKQLGNNFIVGGTFGGGSLSHFLPSNDICNPKNGLPCDNFVLGGPLLVRGFHRFRLGPISDGDHLGCNAFWRLSLHGMTKKLPFIRGESWPTEMRAHVFAEMCQAGNTTSGSYMKWLMDSSVKTVRSTVGVGLVARLGDFGRAELNYCIPLKYTSHDAINRGLQFGIGVVFT